MHAESKYLLQLPQNRWLPVIKYVQVMTHSRCNADCVFCPFVESEHYKHPGMMKDRTWRNILLNLVPWKDSLDKFCPYLMQEPLIDKTIFTKIEQIYELFPNVKVEVSTNGAALTEEVIDKLFTCFDGRRHDIWISHHGINAETLEHIMKIDYQKAHSNVINLLRKSNGRFTIKLRGAGESKAVNKVYFTQQEYKAYWNKLFVDNNLNTANVSVDSFQFHDRAASLHREDRGSCDLNKGIVRQIGPNHKPFYCDRVDKWIHFDYSGGIRLCCMDYHHEIKLPNINEVSLLDYFHSDEYADIIRKVSGRSESDPNFICKRCTSPGG